MKTPSAFVPVAVVNFALWGAEPAAPVRTSPENFGDLLTSGATVERVFTGGHFLEGPAAAPDGSVYFVDLPWTFRFRDTPTAVPAGTIWRYEPKSGTTAVFRSPSGMANGIAFAPDGQMYVAEAADFGGRRVTRTDLSTGSSYIAAGRYRGRPFNAPNDLVIDRGGRIYFTDPRYFGDEPVEQPVEGVYRIDRDGTVHLVAADAGKPNGIALSPDEKTLYVASVGMMTTDFPQLQGMPPRLAPQAILAYDIRADGSLRFRNVVVDFATRAEPRGPDGIKTDANGNLYAAHASWKAVLAFAPDGKPIGRIALPEGAANLAFGRGEDANTLYLAAQTSLYRVRLKTRGWHPRAAP